MFRGHYRHTIDTKGRLSIPSRFRDVLAEGWGDKLVIVPSGKGLDVYPLQVLDPQGRIQISADYRERGALAKDVLIIGMQKRFEVWNAERWAHFERERIGTLDELRARLADKGV